MLRTHELEDQSPPRCWDVYQVRARLSMPQYPRLRTTSRCPMECRLSHSPNEWQCRIYLRFEKDEFGNRLLDVKEKAFGPVIYDKDVLELMLCRAQLAVLNPNTLADSFLTFDAASNNTDFECQLQFSCNVVCLDVSGPDIPDLSFIDLPGMSHPRSACFLLKERPLGRYRLQRRP